MKATDNNAGRGRRALGVMVLAALAFAPGGPRLIAQDKPAAAPVPAKEPAAKSNEPEPGEYNNSLTLGVGHFFSGGDTAAFMRRIQYPSGTFGGVEELHFEQAVGKKGLFELDGRGLFDNHDYSLSLGVRNPDIGYLRGGYSQFRTWFDGSGGYSPTSNAWVTLYNEELFVDRSRAWVEGGLTLPGWPVIGVGYSYDKREGKKDSTTWGDYSLSGNNANPRGIAPTFLDLDEQRHTIHADVKHTIDKTSFGAGVRYEQDDIDNSRNIARRPGDPARQRKVTQTDSTDADILNARAFVETRFTPKAMFAMGYSYTRLDTDIAGSRIYGSDYDSPFNPLYANRQNNDEGFLDLSGGSRVDQYVANLNFMLTPWTHFTIVPSLRIEHQEQVGVAMFTETRVTNAAAPPSLTDVLNRQERDFTDVTESLELRYKGITNWAFYARGEWLEGQSQLEESEFDVEDEGVGPAQLQRDTDSERFVQKYTMGANWYPHRKVNFSGQYYYRSRRNDYDHNVDSTAFNPPATNNLYPAFIERHEFNTHDVNFRMTLRPLAGLTLVSRYDYQVTSYNTKGGANNAGIALGEIESAEATSHIFSQNVSWSPLPRLYLQASISYALQHTDSPVADSTGASANLVQNAENDYWNASVMAGYALTKASDLQAQYYYYRADNYVDNSSVSVPYGAGTEQQGVTVALINRLRKNMLWKIQYGFFTGHDQTSGGHNDYDAHLVYSSWQLLF